MLLLDFHSKEIYGMTGAAHVEVSQDMQDSANSDPDFMNTIITGDKSWMYGYDPENKSEPSFSL